MFNKRTFLVFQQNAWFHKCAWLKTIKKTMTLIIETL